MPWPDWDPWAVATAAIMLGTPILAVVREVWRDRRKRGRKGPTVGP